MAALAPFCTTPVSPSAGPAKVSAPPNPTASFSIDDAAPAQAPSILWCLDTSPTGEIYFRPAQCQLLRLYLLESSPRLLPAQLQYVRLRVLLHGPREFPKRLRHPRSHLFLLPLLHGRVPLNDRLLRNRSHFIHLRLLLSNLQHPFRTRLPTKRPSISSSFIYFYFWA